MTRDSTIILHENSNNPANVRTIFYQSLFDIDEKDLSINDSFIDD